MTPETLAALRTDLGLTTATLADMLDINRRTTERWEAGSTPIPAWLPDGLGELRAEQLAEVDALAAEPGPIIIDPAGSRPVGWQRMVAARVLHRDPARIITDPDGVPGGEYVIHWRDDEITVPRGTFSPAVGWVGRPSWRSLAEALTDMHVRDIDWEGVHPSDLTPGGRTTMVIVAGPRGATRLRFTVELR